MKNKAQKLTDLDEELGIKKSKNGARKSNKRKFPPGGKTLVCTKYKLWSINQAFDHLFPYLLDSRTDTSRPNIVWQMDFTHLNCSLEGAGALLIAYS